MKSPLCKGEVVKGRTNLPYEMENGEILVVKDVPALVCKQCGETFVEIEIVRNVEKIVQLAQKHGLTFGVVKYRDAA